MLLEDQFLKKIEQAKEKLTAITRDKTRTPNLDELSDALDDYYSLSKLKIYCAYLSYTQIIRSNTIAYQKSGFQFLPMIIEAIEGGMFTHPIFRVYNKIRQLFEEVEQQKDHLDLLFTEIKQDIEKHATTLSKEETLELYSYLTNFCIKKINEGKVAYREQAFLINNDITNLIYSGRATSMPINIYQNMIATAILIKDAPLFADLYTEKLAQEYGTHFNNGLHWAERFALCYKSSIEKKHRKTNYVYCSALIAFFQKKHLTAYKRLGNPKHVQGTIFNLKLKVLHLRILYEVNQQAPDTLEKDKVKITKVLEAYRGLIRYEKDKKKQLKYQLDFFVTFEKLFKKLLLFHEQFNGRLYNSKDERYVNKKKELLTLVNNIKYSYQQWLLEKIDEIK